MDAEGTYWQKDGQQINCRRCRRCRLAVGCCCRCRPGDPFFEQQQEEQRELAALAAEAEPVAAPRPAALAAPAATFGTTGAGGAIPGIGDAVAMPVLPQATAAFDVFSIRQQPYDERERERGGRAPPDGPAAAQRHGSDADQRRWAAAAGWLPPIDHCP